MDAHDRQLLELATAKNSLETYIYDARDKLEHDSKYIKASTAEERAKINEKLSETDAWLWDDGVTADTKVIRIISVFFLMVHFSFSIDIKIEIG